MTQLLISVTNVDEALMAMQHGADIIDLKDPHSGALGALPRSVIESVIHVVDGQKQTSATIGDLPMQPDLIVEKIKSLAETQVDFIKIGFFENADYQPCLEALSKMPKRGIKLIAVLFAEYTYPSTIVEDIKQAGFVGLMLDTAHKNGNTILYYRTQYEYKELAARVLKAGMSFGLAGSLRLQDVDKLRDIKPTYMGFRGGICNQHNRRSALDSSKIAAIRNVL